jgi:CubicO group peptidase (beta-lactamase class C family)
LRCLVTAGKPTEETNMKRYAALVLGVWSILALRSGVSAAGLDPAVVEDTKAYVTRLEKVGFSGVLVISENGAPVIAQGYGLADREHGTSWTTKTVSCIGSITKQFTAAGIMNLQEKGLVSVQDPLGKYFPDTPADKANITLHDLLTHSSGLSDPEGVGDYDAIERDEFVRRVLAAPLQFEPGTKYEYVNANFSLLGAVIEKATGKSYERAMNELIFGPAGLKATGYQAPRWDATRIAQGYTGRDRWGTVLERPMAKDGPYWALRANGGIHSTAEEMVDWANALLDGTVLSQKSRDAMWTPFIDESNGDSTSFYGYGWSIMDIPPGVRVVTHNGGNGIFYSDLAIVPDRKIVVFLQTNVIADFPIANDLLARIGSRMYSGTPYPHVPDLVALDRKQLDALAGNYRLDGDNGFGLSVDGNALRVFPKGWNAYAFLHARPEDALAELATMSREIDRIVGAYVKGDFAPLYEAYRKAVPVERLQNAYAQRTQEMQERYGAFKGYDVLGTGSDDRHYLTVVRFRHERGDLTRAYAWERAPEKRLLGMVMGPVDPSSCLIPVKDGGFELWDAPTGGSTPARIAAGANGSMQLVLSRGDREAVARRVD